MMACSAALLAGVFGALHPAFDSFSHFRMHLSALTALLALSLLATSYRLQAVAALVFGAIARFGDIRRLLGAMSSDGS
ncbi:hypothetical protein EN820_54695 [bacterium M00.F.Ca.ET.177.01.1.1]|nr:hypothetical protein EN820_54695 [bacterium M00.F.Ca.ET.177.01.1.1]